MILPEPFGVAAAKGARRATGMPGFRWADGSFCQSDGIAQPDGIARMLGIRADDSIASHGSRSLEPLGSQAVISTLTDKRMVPTEAANATEANCREILRASRAAIFDPLQGSTITKRCSPTCANQYELVSKQSRT